MSSGMSEESIKDKLQEYFEKLKSIETSKPEQCVKNYFVLEKSSLTTNDLTKIKTEKRKKYFLLIDYLNFGEKSIDEVDPWFFLVGQEIKYIQTKKSAKIPDFWEKMLIDYSDTEKKYNPKTFIILKINQPTQFDKYLDVTLIEKDLLLRCIEKRPQLFSMLQRSDFSIDALTIQLQSWIEILENKEIWTNSDQDPKVIPELITTYFFPFRILKKHVSSFISKFEAYNSEKKWNATNFSSVNDFFLGKSMVEKDKSIEISFRVKLFGIPRSIFRVKKPTKVISKISMPALLSFKPKNFIKNGFAFFVYFFMVQGKKCIDALFPKKNILRENNEFLQQVNKELVNQASQAVNAFDSTEQNMDVFFLQHVIQINILTNLIFFTFSNYQVSVIDKIPILNSDKDSGTDNRKFASKVLLELIQNKELFQSNNPLKDYILSELISQNSRFREVQFSSNTTLNDFCKFVFQKGLNIVLLYLIGVFTPTRLDISPLENIKKTLLKMLEKNSFDIVYENLNSYAFTIYGNDIDFLKKEDNPLKKLDDYIISFVKYEYVNPYVFDFAVKHDLLHSDTSTSEHTKHFFTFFNDLYNQKDNVVSQVQNLKFDTDAYFVKNCSFQFKNGHQSSWPVSEDKSANDFLDDINSIFSSQKKPRKK